MIPVTSMTNEEIYIEMQDVGSRMDQFFKEKNLHERNELVPRWRELYRAYDWGFKVNERVEAIAWYGRWEEVVITEYDHENNRFYVRNDKGWEMGLPGMLIRKLGSVVEDSEVLQEEQLVLF